MGVFAPANIEDSHAISEPNATLPNDGSAITRRPPGAWPSHLVPAGVAPVCVMLGGEFYSGLSPDLLTEDYGRGANKMDKSVAVAGRGLHAAEESLFERWSAGKTPFIRDGVVDEGAYLASAPKILFLLKEANRPDGRRIDLRDCIRDKDRPQTWKTVALWILAIRRIQEDLSWVQMESIFKTKSERKEALCSIAAMNLKKEPGGHTTDNTRFCEAVERDQRFLRAQFALYRADIVVCCGSVVTKMFRKFVLPDTKPKSKWPTTRRGVKYYEYETGKHVFDYSHPKARVASSILHYGLIDAVREVRCPSK